MPVHAFCGVHCAVPLNINFPEKEEEIMRWWEENDTFKESVRLSEGRPRWSFYDGPPFATGLPHYGHILAGTIKVPRSPAAHTLNTTEDNHLCTHSTHQRALYGNPRPVTRGLASICLLSIQRQERAP